MKYEDLEKKRDELNILIENNADYDLIYKVSVELDILIEKFYGLNIELI